MRVWRISNQADLSGRGGLLAEGRWNQLGVPVVYCSDHPATAMLEMLAHLDRDGIPRRFRLLAIDLPDDAPSTTLREDALPPDWREGVPVTRRIGTEVLRANDHLWIVVPCVLVPAASNILLNPNHPDASRCRIAGVSESPLDFRLVR